LIASPTGDAQANQMSGMMNIYMPLLMGWFAYSLASGLALYFLASNLFSIIQYAILGRVNIKNLLPGKKMEVTKKGE